MGKPVIKYLKHEEHAKTTVDSPRGFLSVTLGMFQPDCVSSYSFVLDLNLEAGQNDLIAIVDDVCVATSETLRH